MELSDVQRKELQRLSRTAPKARERVQVLVLLNLAAGRSLAETARIFQVSRPAVQRWRDSYCAGGVEALAIRPGRGRKPRADLQELEAHVRQSPRAFGLAQTRWTLSALARTVPSLKDFTPFGVQQTLRRAGFSYKRAQPAIHSPDPEYSKKKAGWTKR